MFRRKTVYAVVWGDIVISFHSEECASNRHPTRTYFAKSKSRIVDYHNLNKRLAEQSSLYVLVEGSSQELHQAGPDVLHAMDDFKRT